MEDVDKICDPCIPMAIENAKRHLARIINKPGWLTEECLTADAFGKLKTEERIIFGFSFFPILFQDNINNPYIFLCSVLYQLIAVLYDKDNNLQEASILQCKLNFFLSWLENLMPPYFETIGIHTFVHTFEHILNHGCLSEVDNFGNERSLQTVIKNMYPCRYVYRNASRRLSQLDVATVFSTDFYWELYKVGSASVVSSDYVSPSLPSDILDITIINIHKDVLNHNNGDLVLPTYLDALLLNLNFSPEYIKSKYGVDERFFEDMKVESIKWYKSISVGGQIAEIVDDGTSSLDVIRSKCRSFCYLRSRDNKFRLFCIKGFFQLL